MGAEIVYLAEDGRRLSKQEVTALTGEERLAARDRAARNAGITEGRKRERAELARIGLQTQEEYSHLAQLRAERDARPTAEEERKHGRHQRWMGGLYGYVFGALSATLVILFMQRVIWDTSIQSAREQAMTGAIISSQGEGERNEAYTNPGQDVTRRP